ncbi:DNA-directed RNA polymerase I subunit rpa49 [Trapelia coarctata]|nr:DNA-directed RNA polymerase I subunit rpa49 [Trapelia coarctata]
MADKKRKHTGEGGDRPSKKSHTEVSGQASTVWFSVVQDVGEWAPAIATTPGLDLPTNVPLKAYKRARTGATHRGTAAGRSRQSDSELLLHCSAHPKLDYTAREEVSGGAESLLRHYVGVYDPKTGELQVVPARNVVVRGTLRPPPTAENGDKSSDEEKVPQSRLKARTILGEAFGTKKSQKAIRSLTENAIFTPKTASQTSSGKTPLDPLASAVLESMSQVTSSMPTREELQAAVDDAKPRPKANLDATTPADVYKIEDLIGIEMLKSLSVRQWQDDIKADKAIETHSRFVSHRVIRVVQSGDVKRLKALRYVLLMLDWFGGLKPGQKGAKRLPQREDIRKAVGEEIQDFLVDGLRRKFAPDKHYGGSAMNKWAIDNFMTHISALAVIIDHFETDMADLQNDLKLDTKQMSQYFHEIGCRVAALTEPERIKFKIDAKEKSTHRIAKLRLPLEFPKIRTPAAKKRK